VLPFSEEEFLRVFAEYNGAVWPAQLLLYAAAVIALLLAAGSRPRSDRVSAATLREADASLRPKRAGRPFNRQR
jgi:hypothetical protein